MLHEKLLEKIYEHVALLDEARKRRLHMGDTLSLYAVLHALQVHAQAVIDYLLHTCAVLGVSVETPIRCTRRLEEEGLLEREEAGLLRRLVRFRDLVVHEYGSIDVGRVRRVVESRGYLDAAEMVRRLHERLGARGLPGPLGAAGRGAQNYRGPLQPPLLGCRLGRETRPCRREGAGRPRGGG